MGNEVVGRPFLAHLHSANASLGEAIPIYENGSDTAYTLGDDEFLEIHSVAVVTVPGGDVMVFVGADATPGAGEYLLRGTFAANGGMVHPLDPPVAGDRAETLWVDAPNGVVDVTVVGTIRKSGEAIGRPTWKESGV